MSGGGGGPHPDSGSRNPELTETDRPPRFCQATGYGGTTKRLLTLEDKLADRRARPREDVERAAAQREVTVRFNADVVEGVPWKFRPTQRSVRVSPGESTLAFYTVKNNSDKPVIGVSTYNVSPQQAGQYFNKIQCFCFEEQRLLANEEVRVCG